MRKTILAAAVAAAPLLAALPVPALAQAAPVDGTVQKVDEGAGKLTLKHGPIRNLDMDGMTMVFRVQDPALLKTVKAGDKVRFEADRVNGALTVTKIERVK
ncbi:copper-binding protein [Chelatococcus sp. SYSU_G07232]|uniref:Copper-binding protein n=1 Tax=Chelatococcus albus TaxID=3047466 RepID=A0ABT7AEH2_9HYPH|nr:copper-binding protein [Chelatococcus sp. SYSU_G07232]MDJ1157776.1 copper-binding protein [Chelatococcus sp. SYSU_G07232]